MPTSQGFATGSGTASRTPRPGHSAAAVTLKYTPRDRNRSATASASLPSALSEKAKSTPPALLAVTAR
jgi:hypothetical protein